VNIEGVSIARLLSIPSNDTFLQFSVKQNQGLGPNGLVLDAISQFDHGVLIRQNIWQRSVERSAIESLMSY
jgi:hypothetical protein